ncbi:MAG: inorganic phosphate transporter [Nitrospirae bacterium]|nr:inorganic phosphate transporter [Nitrospirota bacterium]
MNSVLGAKGLFALVAVIVGLLAFANGANDNFKGVATLFGSGTTRYRSALVWAAATTLAGSVCSFLLAGELMLVFSGKGIVPNELVGQPGFLSAVGAGAAGSVLLATRFGFPISTTHALVGGLVGGGLVASSGQVQFAALAGTFVLPLIAGPIAALGLTFIVYGLGTRIRRWMGISKEFCVCVGREEQVVAVGLNPAGEGYAAARSLFTVRADQPTRCHERYQGEFVGLGVQSILNGVHFFSSGAVGFARGLNDTPKIAALLMVAGALRPEMSALAVALVMALGGLVAARRVAHTMSQRITEMNHGQGLAGNLVTAALVVLASRWGMPVSTTHVSVGSLLGVGVVSHKARWAMIRQILVAWIVTLPVAAGLSAATYCLWHSLS